MKLLYIHQYFVFPENNGGTRSYDLAQSFVKKGIDLEIVTSSAFLKGYFKNRWTKLERDGLIIHVLKLNYCNDMSYLKRIWVFIAFLLFATFKVLKLKTDVVLATSTPLTISIPALVKYWIQKTPFIFEARDIWPEAVIAIGAVKNPLIIKLLYKLELSIYKNAKYIVVLSSDMMKSINKRYTNIFMNKVWVIENISEVNRFQKGFRENKEEIKSKIGFKPSFTVLYAGTFGKVNNLRYVIQLCERLMKIDPYIVFLLLGEGAEKNEIIKIAESKGVLNKNIFIIDSVAKEDLPQYYHEADMGSSFVAPIKELWANSANKFFDTLAAGRPILINHEGWQKEVIERNNIGYVLPGNAEELTQRVLIGFVNYTHNCSILTEQCNNAYNLAKEKYSLDVASSKYILIFNKIIEDISVVKLKKIKVQHSI